jgi:hypothetical protein
MDEYEIRQRQCKKGKELKEVGREKENKNTRKARGVGKLLGWILVAGITTEKKKSSTSLKSA